MTLLFRTTADDWPQPVVHLEFGMLLREVANIIFRPIPIRCAAFPFLRTAAMFNDFFGTRRLGVWSVKSGTCEAILQGHEKKVRCVAWSPDGRQVATGNDAESVRLWSADGKALKVVGHLDGPITSVTYTPDSKAVLVTIGAVKAWCAIVIKIWPQET